MAMIPLHPQLSKMLILSCIFQCLKPILGIVAVLNEKDPFVLKSQKEMFKVNATRKNFSKGSESDHIMYANVLHQYEDAWHSDSAQNFVRKNHLNDRILNDVFNIMEHLKDKLKVCGLMVKDEKFYNKNSNNESLIKGVIAGGLFPQVRPIGFNAGRGNRFPYLSVLEENKRLYIARKSVNQENVMFSSGSQMTYFVLRG